VVENINGSFTEFKASHRTSKEIAIVDGTVSVKTFAVVEAGFHVLNGKYLHMPTRKHRKRVRHSGFNDHPVNNDATSGMPIVNRGLRQVIPGEYDRPRSQEGWRFPIILEHELYFWRRKQGLGSSNPIVSKIERFNSQPRNGYTRGNICGEFRSIGTFLSGSGGLLQVANLFGDLRYHFVCLLARGLHFSQLSAHGSKLSAHHNALMTHFSRLSSNFPERTNCDDDTGDANQAENDLRQYFRRRQLLEITIAWSCGSVLLLWGCLLIDHCNPRFVHGRHRRRYWFASGAGMACVAPWRWSARAALGY